MEQNPSTCTNAFTRDEILFKKLKYLGFIQEPHQEFNIHGSSMNFFKDQAKHFRNLGFPTAMETKSRILRQNM